MTENPGTKCLTLSGAVKRPGIVEVPLGTPIRDILFEIGGGGIDGQPIKAVHIGGPVGGYLCPEHLDTPFEHEALEQRGLRMGAGTIEVLDHSVCIVNRIHTHFQQTLQELCGQCTAGREGIYQIASIVQAICEGTEIPGGYTQMADIQHALHEICDYIQQTGMCVYCKYATLSLVSSMNYFRKEFEEHLQKRCKAGVCF
jgi:NADH:ubiquinone oxidoreductase subunit F (NADH-binding)